MTCFDCGSPAHHHHHVVPRSRGGVATVPLCVRCHGLAHGRSMTTPSLTRDALSRKRTRGERVGAVPYGSRLADDGRTLLDDEGEQAVIREARELRAAGLSLRGVAAELARRGRTGRTGRTFKPTQVVRMLGASK